MQKILINTSIGGFGISKEAQIRLLELKSSGAKEEQAIVDSLETDHPELDCSAWDYFCTYINRDDPILIKVFEDYGELMNGKFAKLKIVQIPDGIKWSIFTNDDGTEAVHQDHQIWK